MKKKTVVTLLQVLVTIGILGWIFHNPEQRAKMWDAVTHDLLWPWIFAGLVSYGIVEVLGATRWQLLLRVQGIHITWFRLVKLLMIGIFFNQLMPGGTGGDVVKIFYLLRETPNKKPEAVLAVLMDRLVGLIGLIFVAGAVIIWNWGWLTQHKPIPRFEAAWLLSFDHMKSWLAQIPFTTQLLYTLLAILAFTVLGLVTSFVITGFGLARKLPAKFPKRDLFVDLSKAYNSYARAWETSLAAILMSFAVHIFSFLSFYAAARAIHVRVPLLEFCAVMPIVNTLTALPISVGGAGVREGLFQTILPALTSVTAADATVLSILGYLIMVSWGILGSIVYLRYRPTEHAKLSDIQAEVGKLEHEIAEAE